MSTKELPAGKVAILWRFLKSWRDGSSHDRLWRFYKAATPKDAEWFLKYHASHDDCFEYRVAAQK